MRDKKPARLGDLQLAILKILWERGEAATTEVHVALEASHGLAPTTVATMLRKMETRGLVSHREEGRRFIYRATLAETDAASSAAVDVLDRLFDSSLAGMVSHLLELRKVDADELDELARLVAKKRRKPSA
jgi:BlaI family transcriptional regulator, penicillinase repressor